MRLPQIRMESTFAQIDTSSTNGRISIEQPQGELQIQQEHATMNVQRTPSRLTIDQSQAWRDVNLMSIIERNDLFAREGYQQLMQFISKKRHEGDELMKIEHGGGVIPSQAKRNSEGPPKQFGLGWIPSPFAVKIDYDPGQLNIDIRENKPVIDYKANQPIISYTPGGVETKMKQFNSLTIDFIM